MSKCYGDYLERVVLNKDKFVFSEVFLIYYKSLYCKKLKEEAFVYIDLGENLKFIFLYQTEIYVN